MSFQHILQRNRDWALRVREHQPNFFTDLAATQSPKYLWIGCSDSRVPANQVLDLPAGGVFVHRNIANIVVHTDLNCLSVIHYAVEILKVEHILVVGHYGCGGIAAAMDNQHHGMIDNWLLHIKDLYLKHQTQIDDLSCQADQLDKLCELNVIEQVKNVCLSTPVTHAWQRGQRLAVHGCVYRLEDGILQNLQVSRVHE